MNAGEWQFLRSRFYQLRVGIECGECRSTCTGGFGLVKMQYIPRLKTAYKQPHPPQYLFNKVSRSLFANLDQTRITGLMAPFLPHTLKRIGLLDIEFAGAQGSFTSGSSRWERIETVLLTVSNSV